MLSARPLLSALLLSIILGSTPATPISSKEKEVNEEAIEAALQLKERVGPSVQSELSDCILEVETTYTKECGFPSKTESKRIRIDLRTVSIVEQREIRGSYFLAFRPKRTLISMLLFSHHPVDGQTTLRKCDGSFSSNEDEEFAGFIIPGSLSPELGAMLNVYIENQCQN